MIPKIITITEGENVDTLISVFAKKNNIEPSHRIVVRPEKDELTVMQIHLMQKDIQVAFSKKVLVVLRNVDYSSNEVQNALLKCLEDDSERIQFLLLVTNPERLLSTIRSRCAMIESRPVSHKSEVIHDYSALFSFQKNSDVTKDEAVERIDMFLQSSSLKEHHVLHHLLFIRKLIIDNNMNPVLALDNILIFLSKTSTMKVIHEN